jgi:hypothetical protein
VSPEVAVGDASDLDPADATPATSRQAITAPAMLRSFTLNCHHLSCRCCLTRSIQQLRRVWQTNS